MLKMASMFIPASAPRMINGGISFIVDSIIFDLEDAVAASEKDAARDMLYYALPLFKGKNVAVRINGIDSCWLEDLKAVGPHNLNTIVVPKADVASVCAVSEMLDKMNVDTEIALLIESAASLENVSNIARASKRVRSLLLGAEDFCFDMGIERTKDGAEILYARSKIAVAAKTLGLEALDTPFTDVSDTEGLEKDARFAKSLGFTGKLAISPLQVETIKTVFMPSEKETEWAKKVINASGLPENLGKGAFSLDGKMVDAPVIKRALSVLERGGYTEGQVDSI